MKIYCLLLVAILLLFLPVIYAEEQNIGVAKKDGFELTLKTDKKEYHEGEVVEISFILTNTINRYLTYLDTPCGLRISIDGYRFNDLVQIRRSPNGNFTGEHYVQEPFSCIQVEREFTFFPNESREGKVLWTQEVSRNGEPFKRMEIGTYNISYTAFWGFTSTVPVKIIENQSHLTPSPSPRQQIANGSLPENIICKKGLQLIFKSKDNSPACVKPQTVIKLVERGWGSTSVKPIQKPESKINPNQLQGILTFLPLANDVGTCGGMQCPWFVHYGKCGNGVWQKRMGNG